MNITHKDIKKLLVFLNYKETSDSFFEKKYENNYKISVNFNEEKINYFKPIKLGDETTSNFKSSENFVVLECVNRLLEKGYKPSSIELEHKWRMGRQEKGKLDILVKDNDGTTYLMIECKVWGNEYEKEGKKMLVNGGQLFSYYQQDKNTRYMCLYTSKLKSGKVEYQNKIVKADDSFKNLGEIKEVFNRWNKEFIFNGIFEDSIRPYNIKIKALTRGDLKPIEDEEASSRIYNQFLEILRHNVVSDKGNAFNKIFSLFLCKVLDEDKPDRTELDFQWIDGKDSEKTLLSRLNSLYKKGMKEYLDKDITDYTEEDLGSKINQRTAKIFEELRLYKSQEFAFVDVFNEESFLENAKIVKEVVQLLENRQIRYTHKQQFLGDFFELLLNTGFKQESGQFFTPVPLVRFIIKSLPINKIIEKKLLDGKKNFLPYVIDFSCGAGHFLTEAMDIIQEKIKNMDENKLTTTTQKRNMKTYCENHFSWAKDFIYGIERDYRLVKTTKLACFLHGDGEATVIHASGIAPFTHESYPEKLRSSTQENNIFDVLIANPPYSVSGFKSTVESGDQSFSLYKNISGKSSEIEVLFIERMKQLLKPGGVAGIILPQTILSKGGNYEKARDIILGNFYIRSIVSLGKKAFAATGTSTVILFLEKRLNPVNLDSKESYLNAVKSQKVIVVESPEAPKLEKEFLGYYFSGRKKSEGIYIDGGSLADEESDNNPQKASSYILKNMLREPVKVIDKSLEKFVKVLSLEDLFEWENISFNNQINPKKKVVFKKAKQGMEERKLKDFCEIKKGTSITEKGTEKGNISVVAGGKAPAYYHNKANRRGNIITVSASGSAGFVNLYEEPIFASDCTTIQSKDSEVSTVFLYYVLKHMQEDFYNIKKVQNIAHVYGKDFENFIVPIPEKTKQISMTNELNKLRSRIKINENKINEYSPNFKVKNNWKEVILGDVCDFVRGPFGGNLKKEIFVSSGFAVYEQSHAIKNDFTNFRYYITEDKFNEMLSLKVNPNDLIMSCSGTFGKTAIVPQNAPEGIINQALLKLSPHDCLQVRFLQIWLNGKVFQNILNSKALGVGIRNVANVPTLKNTKIPLPSLKAQEKIIEKINAEEAGIEGYKQEIEKIKEEMDLLVLSELWE